MNKAIREPVEPKKTIVKVLYTTTGPECINTDDLNLVEFIEHCKITSWDQLKYVTIFNGSHPLGYGDWDDYYRFEYSPEAEYENESYEKEYERYLEDKKAYEEFMLEEGRAQHIKDLEKKRAERLALKDKLDQMTKELMELENAISLSSI